MHPIQEAITGKESHGDLSFPYQALVQFYCAFNLGNIQMMSENWAQSDDIAMDNPLGSIKRGWPEIQLVYERILNGPAEIYVGYFDYTIHETSEMFYAVGRERRYFHLDGDEITLAIRASRIFQQHRLGCAFGNPTFDAPVRWVNDKAVNLYKGSHTRGQVLRLSNERSLRLRF